MTRPSPFAYTEDALRSFVSDCVQTLKDPLCPVLTLRTLEELDMWMETLRALEAEAEKDWTGVQ